MLALLVNGFILIYMLFALFWDSPESNLIEKKLKSVLRPFVIRLGLSYRWNMYSGPFTHIVEVQARATYDDGTTEVVALPRRYEFRRYCFMLGRQRRSDLYEAFGAYVECWLARQNRYPAAITIVRQVVETPVRLGGLRGRFDVTPLPNFRESVVARRVLL